MSVNEEKDEYLLKLSWIRVDRKTDIVALTAFMLALFATILQIKDWVKGSEIELYSPDRVVLYNYKQSNGIPIVRIAAPMSYTNAASSEYPSAVRSEAVTMKIGDLTSRQEWISFARLARNENGFDAQINSDASPLPIPGGGAISHSTLFGPFEADCSQSRINDKCRSNENYISIKAMSAAVGDADEIRLDFEAHVLGSKTLKQACVVKITQAVTEQWAENNWLIASCHRVKTR